MSVSETATVSGIRTTQLPSGEPVAVLGQGTWGMGERAANRREELHALSEGLDLGLTLIDTAEMYGGGAAEALVGEAIANRRAEVFLVSKVLPQHASERGTIDACEQSLRRLNTDRIDLYLLHWREDVPLEQTLAGLARLIEDGKIRHWGVSNFDVSDLEELTALDLGAALATNQVLYNLTRRGIEFALLPWCRERAMPIMAYSPVEQGRLLKSKHLEKIAARLNATPAQVALAWAIREDGVIAIPKAARVEHVHENRQALDLHLTETDLAELDQTFRPPRKATPLEMI